MFSYKCDNHDYITEWGGVIQWISSKNVLFWLEKGRPAGARSWLNIRQVESVRLVVCLMANVSTNSRPDDIQPQAEQRQSYEQHIRRGDIAGLGMLDYRKYVGRAIVQANADKYGVYNIADIPRSTQLSNSGIWLTITVAGQQGYYRAH